MIFYNLFFWKSQIYVNFWSRKGEFMKHLKLIITVLALTLAFHGCAKPEKKSTDEVEILLSDDEIKISDRSAAHIAHDIVYYEEGHDFTYGEGTQKDAHNKAEADEHTVVHITKAGTYRLQGNLSTGQVAIDLGEDAKNDPNAVVTLILNGVDITCELAPAIIFYNVYECETGEENASHEVDTSLAGANVIIADGSENIVNGSYVARIYKPDSVVLNEDGTEVEDADKLHKYDAAFYSKMSMNVCGKGKLTINAENEGLDSEMHLTINAGEIFINSGNDGINTNEDGISVTTVNGGEVHIRVTGETGEGDGIDSNGWLVINGGVVTTEACSASADSGIDSDMGIHINGGTVIASGNMLDRISESDATFAVFNFLKPLGEGTYTLKKGDTVILEKEIENSFTSLIVTSPDLTDGDYTLWYNDTPLVGATGENGGGMRPDFPKGEMPEGVKPPDFPKGEMPEGVKPPDFPKGEMPEKKPFQEGDMTPPDKMSSRQLVLSEIFTIKQGANYFSFISEKE